MGHLPYAWCKGFNSQSNQGSPCFRRAYHQSKGSLTLITYLKLQLDSGVGLGPSKDSQGRLREERPWRVLLRMSGLRRKGTSRQPVQRPCDGIGCKILQKGSQRTVHQDEKNGTGRWLWRWAGAGHPESWVTWGR